MGRVIGRIVVGVCLSAVVPVASPAATAAETLVHHLGDGRAFATIDGAVVAASGDDVCRRLAVVPELSSITFARVAPTPECLEALAGLPRLSQLTLRTEPSGPAMFAALGRLRSLTELTLEFGRETPAGLAAAFPEETGLRRVVLSMPVDGETLRRLGRSPRLTELEIAGTTAADGHAALAGAGALERLVTTVETDADLAVLARLPKLRELVLDVGPRIGATGLRQLAASKTIETISYSSDGPTAGIGELAAMPRLHHLRLVYQTVPDAELDRLARAPALSSLDLREATVTNAGLAALAKSRSLKSVSLRQVAVSAKVRRLLARRMEVDTGE